MARWPEGVLVMAPRKPERFVGAGGILAGAGWHPVRRSACPLDGLSAGVLGGTGATGKSVLLLDSLCELAALYALADVVFIGGSLVPVGGHNPLEPAAFAKVPIFGRSMDNFREIAASLLEAGAAIRVDSAAQLGAAWIDMLANNAKRAEMGLAARQIVERNRGATAATLDRVAAIIEPHRAHT